MMVNMMNQDSIAYAIVKKDFRWAKSLTEQINLKKGKTVKLPFDKAIDFERAGLVECLDNKEKKQAPDAEENKLGKDGDENKSSKKGKKGKKGKK